MTAGRSDRVGAELRRHGIEGLFEAVVYGDDDALQKPDPAPLRAALAGLGRDAAGSVYVGDTPDDMRMAVAAGVRAVGIESVLGDAAELRAAGADETAPTTVGWVETRLGGAVHARPTGRGAEPEPMRALIVAAGRLPDRGALDTAWPGWADGVDLVVAADAGAAAAETLGLRPDLVVGDFDSLDADGLDRLRAEAIPIEVAPEAKDESDTELAILAALRRGADRLTIVGGLGGRPDHLLANIGLLGHPALGDRPIELLDDRTRVTLVRGPGRRELVGRVGDLVSLLALGPGVEGVTTSGLRWALTPSRPAGPARAVQCPVDASGQRRGELRMADRDRDDGPSDGLW